ncbi:LTA synthase family protein [Daejeonella sp.]|uniref:LTA synthase family protein n=1 Tax=Daejeonella sp. TaxID=2805397 RepID=UPI002731F541|nr:sulfatase-like hydrolase/transferase [Daejeonella sp.]MDP2415058.1 sulfatase-like hydrolase/transferase [Daejeonella sp.]
MEQNQKSENQILSKFYNSCQAFAGIAILWLILILLLSVIENIFNSITHGLESGFFEIMVWSSVLNVLYWLKLLFFLFIVFTAIYFFSAKFARFFFQAFIVFLFIIQLGLLLYFNTSLVPLGADLYSYSMEDINQTLGASGGVSFLSVSVFIILTIGVIAALHFLSRRIKLKRIPAITLPVLSAIYLLSGISEHNFKPDFQSEFENNLIENKSDYFLKSSYTFLFPEKIEIDIYDDSYIGDFADNEESNIEYEYVDEINYPFLHKDASQDVLSPFFNTGDSPPNIVMLIAEGLGRAFSNEGAYLGSFTPFLDSLSDQSLSWNNALSQGGRTFAVLPSILGSLPFAKSGFLELEKMPDQLSLLNLLKFNGYQTSFYYSGDASFDRMRQYLEANDVDEIRDEKTFPKGYLKLPKVNNFSWGYNDKELFRYYLASRPAIQNAKPQLNIILTVSTHNNFLINESDKYARVFEQHMNILKFNDSKKLLHRKNRIQYVSILYMDDAIRLFMNEYKKRADFANTIFIITGDHRMPEIPMSTKIDRYHVPMIVYSPLLKRTARFSSVSSHFDLPPTLLAFLKNNYKIKLPGINSWIGEGLDTSRNFRNLHRIPLIQNKTDIIDFVMGEYHLNGNDLFKLNPGMDEERLNDDARKNQLLNEFNLFKKRNAVITNGGKIIPDSLYKNYTLPK